ncbi:hypothetical protein EYF80_021693 [Liparis tanakae]|uniref:Uncharacterized protein n=1 Tax=Liparis tanakae TaxID=230148 RepID=A0A4Z2HQM1_9TELE|nr:hypothetical protein EYF80_021693 [Liparis tanakae]
MVAWKGTQKMMKKKSATLRLRMNRLVVLYPTCPLRRSTASTRLLPMVPSRKMREKTTDTITLVGFSCQEHIVRPRRAVTHNYNF